MSAVASAPPAHTTRWRVARWVAGAALAGVSLAAIAVLFAVASRRLFDPVEVGNVEGELMDEVARLLAHRPLYAAPTLDYIPLAYMPGYFYAVLPFARVFGPELWVGRMVGFGETLALMALMGAIVWRETRRVPLALAAPGLFAMSYGLVGGIHDQVQINSQFILLALAGLAVLRWTRGRTGAVAAAALLAAGFFSKQHAVQFAIAALPWVWFADRRRFVTFAIALLVFCGGGYLLLARLWGPWFSFYTWDVPSHWSQLSRVRVIEFIGRHLLGDLAVCSVAGAIALASEGRVWAEPEGLWWWAGLGGTAAGLMATLDPYAYRPTLLPTIAGLVVLGPIAAHRVASRAGAARDRAAAVLAAALLAQYVPLLYPARHFLPPPHGREARAVMLSRLSSLPPGPVWLPLHGAWTRLAGRGIHASVLPLDDVLRARGNRLLARDPQAIARLFDALARDPHRPWIVSDCRLDSVGDVSRPLFASLARAYRPVDTLGQVTEWLRPVVGLRLAPSIIYAPTDSAGPARR